MDQHFTELVLSLLLPLSLFSRSRWCNVRLGMEPSSVAAMHPVLTHGYSFSFSASNPHFNIISSPARVCEHLTADDDYRFLPMNQRKHNLSLSLSHSILSICTPVIGFTHPASRHSRTGCPFRLDTITHLCVCV